MSKREPDPHDDHGQFLIEKIGDLSEEIDEMETERKNSLLHSDMYISKLVILMSLFLIISHPMFLDFVIWREIYPLFSLIVLSSILGLIALSLTDLLNARGVLDDE